MTPLPVVLAVDEDRDALGIVESQLTQRYAHDYRVLCLSDAGEAPQKLAALARAGQDVALVLAGTQQSAIAPDGLFDRVRELHPHAKRALPCAAFHLDHVARNISGEIGPGNQVYARLFALDASNVVNDLIEGVADAQ